mgnify:CR=1 FL=1
MSIVIQCDECGWIAGSGAGIVCVVCHTKILKRCDELEQKNEELEDELEKIKNG